MNALLFFSIIGLAVATFVIASLLLDRRAMNARRRRISSRPHRDHETWYRDLYAPRGIEKDLATDVVARLADVLKCEMTQIYPDDSFTDELGLRNIWWIQIDPDDELTYFSEAAIEELVGSDASDQELASLRESRTIEDLLTRIARIRGGSSH